MCADDRTRAREALHALSEKHRALSAAVGAAATWAAAAASRTRQEADDVAWRRATAEVDEGASVGAWDNVLRDYQPLVVWPEYAQRLLELHDDLGTALLGPAAYKSVSGLAPANSLRTVKDRIESAWRDDRASQPFDGYLPEAAAIYDQMCMRHHEWIGKVHCAADVLEQTGHSSLWMRSTYASSVRDRLDRVVRVLRDVYAATARAQFEPLVLMEWNSRHIPMTTAALEARGLRYQDDVRSAITSRVASIIDEWIGALMVGGLSEQERDVTVRTLEDQFPDAMTAWRGICAARVANRHPALQVPQMFYDWWSARSAS